MLAVGGSWVAPKDAIAAGDFARITQLAREAVRAARRRMSRPARQRRAFDWSAAVIAALADHGSAIFVFFRDGQARFLAILTDDLGLFGTMLPKVLAGCLIGAFVTLLLPRETDCALGRGGVRRSAASSSRPSRARSCPGGPFTIYPVAGAFLAAGADAGAACAFVISWTLIGYTRAHRLGASVLRPRLRHLADHLLAAAADPRRVSRREHAWQLHATHGGAA